MVCSARFECSEMTEEQRNWRSLSRPCDVRSRQRSECVGIVVVVRCCLHCCVLEWNDNAAALPNWGLDVK